MWGASSIEAVNYGIEVRHSYNHAIANCIPISLYINTLQKSTFLPVDMLAIAGSRLRVDVYITISPFTFQNCHTSGISLLSSNQEKPPRRFTPPSSTSSPHSSSFRKHIRMNSFPLKSLGYPKHLPSLTDQTPIPLVTSSSANTPPAANH